MVKPGRRNLITDVPGVLVGNADDAAVRTGVSVILPTRPATVGVDVRGGAPGTRETPALDPNCLVAEAHAIVLAGGSVFGLAAADAVTAALSARGIGLALSPRAVPVVPAAILYDLGNGGDKAWGETPPYVALGRQALAAADEVFSLGNAGAGFGAIAGALKGGLGSASADCGDGFIVGALIAVNSFGSVTTGGPSDALMAAPFEQGGEFGALPALALPRNGQGVSMTPDLAKAALPAANTTIGVVATNARLTKAEAERLAIMAHDGLARAIRPVHTPFDGDTLFAMATGERELGDNRPLALTRLGAVAADCVARAVAHGVLAAKTLGEAKAYREVFFK